MNENVKGSGSKMMPMGQILIYVFVSGKCHSSEDKDERER